MKVRCQLRQLIITLYVVLGATHLYALSLGNRIELDHTTTSGTGWTYSNDVFTEDFDMTGATANPTKIGNNVLRSGEKRAGQKVSACPVLTIDGTESLMSTFVACGAGIGSGSIIINMYGYNNI